MRKAKREIQDRGLVEELLRSCRIVHLGLWDGEQPYVVTVNFGYEAGAIYFHCAADGRKAECLRRNGLVSFQAVAEYEVLSADKACGFTTHYKSISGFGRGRFLTDPADKARGLDVLLRQHGGPVGTYDPKVLQRTSVVRVDLESLTGKVNPAFPGDPQV